MTNTAVKTETAPGKTQMSNKARWFRFVVLVMAGGTIYKLANLHGAFYVPMQEHFGLSNTQIGLLLTVNSIVATVMFVIGGYLADRFPTRILIPVGLLGAGGLGLVMSTMPGFGPLVGLWALLAICSDCFVWPALLKSVRLLGKSDEQGRMFGFLEAGRGIVDTIVAFSALGVFALLGSGAEGLRGAILFFAIVDIVIGVLVLVLLREHKPEQDAAPAEKKKPAGLRTILDAARIPQLWWVSLTVFMVYVVFCGLTYFIPFLTQIYAMPAALAGAYGIIVHYGLKMVGGPVGGFMADKVVKSPSRYLRWAFVALVPAMVIVLLIPADPGFQIPAVVATLLFSAVVFSMRGVFWAPMDEVGMPKNLSGTAFGIASLVGYAPGMFAFIIYGAILDANPGVLGYRLVFVLMAVLALVGAGVATVLVRVARRQKAKETLAV